MGFCCTRVASILGLCVVSSFALLGCGNNDVAVTSPTQAPSLGAAVYTLWCDRLASAHWPEDVAGSQTYAMCRDGIVPALGAPAKLMALHAQRTRFISAVDAAIGPDLTGLAHTLTIQLLPLYDDGTLERHGASMATALTQLSQNPSALMGLSSWVDSAGQGAAHTPITRAALASPHAPDLLALAAQAMVQEPVALASVLAGIHEALKHLPDSTLRAAEAWLAKLALVLLAPGDSGPPHVLAADAPTPGQSQVPRMAQTANRASTIPPFVNRANAGLAEVDARGNFLSVQNTLLAEVCDEVAQAIVSGPQDVWPWVKPLQALLQAPAADPKARAAQAGAEALDTALARLAPQSATLARVAAHLLTTESYALAHLVQVLTTDDAAPLAPQDDGMGVRLGEDLLAWLSEVAQVPRLLESLLEALADPATAGLGPLLAAQLRYVDPIDFDVNDVNGPVVGTLQTPVNAQRPISIFGRLLRLVTQTAGTPVCNAPLDEPMPTYPACALFHVPDAAVFYLDALAGTAELTLKVSQDDFFFPDQFAEAVAEMPGKSEMEAFSGIDGFVRKIRPDAPGWAENFLHFSVTPQAAARLLFALHDPRVAQNSLFGMTRAAVQQVAPRLLTRSGEPFDTAFGGTLFAWEQGAFLPSVAPLAGAFVHAEQHGLLVRVMGLLDKDFAALSADHPAWLATLAYQLDEGHLLAHAGHLLRAAAVHQQAPKDLPIWPVLADVLRAWVTAPPQGGPSPALTLWRAARVLGEAPGGPEPRASWAAGLTLQDEDTGDVQFARPKWLGFIARGLTALRAHASDEALPVFALAPWLQSPTVSGAVTLMAAALNDPTSAQTLRSFVWHLLTHEREATLTAVADLLQRGPPVPPVTDTIEAAAQALLPPGGAVAQSLQIFARIFAPDGLDKAHVAATIVQRLHTPMSDLCHEAIAVRDAAGCETPLMALWDIFWRINRVAPENDGPQDAADMHLALSQIAAFLRDEDHGLQRLLALALSRDKAGAAL